MGNLSSQYISQSFQSLLHLGSDTTASATLAEIQDALGNGVGVFVSTAGNLKVTNSISASAISASTLFGIGNTVSYSASVADQLKALENVTSSLINVTGSYATTGSNNFIGNQSVTGDLNLTGTLTAYAVKTIFETSSVIYSSGSNQFGDASNDTQTLIGRTNLSGSLSVTGSSIAFKGEVSASYISSSRIEGLGGTTVTNFSSSIASQFYTQTDVYNPNNDTKWSTLQPLTASFINNDTNLCLFTASANTQLTNLSTSASIYNTKWTTLGNLSSSFATTGSNTFIGTEIITGSLTITGSAFGNIVSMSIVSNTASIDMSKGNFFTLTLANSTNTRIETSNVKQGESLSLLITTGTNSSASFASTVKFPEYNAYTASYGSGKKDIISFITFDNTTIYAAAINNLI